MAAVLLCLAGAGLILGRKDLSDNRRLKFGGGIDIFNGSVFPAAEAACSCSFANIGFSDGGQPHTGLAGFETTMNFNVVPFGHAGFQSTS